MERGAGTVIVGRGEFARCAAGRAGQGTTPGGLVDSAFEHETGPTASPSIRGPTSACAHSLSSNAFHQLDAISEWIVDVDTLVAFERLVFQ